MRVTDELSHPPPPAEARLTLTELPTVNSVYGVSLNLQQSTAETPQVDQAISESSCPRLCSMQGKEGKTETEKLREGKVTAGGKL